MEKKMFIKRLEEEESVVEFYKYKPEILRHLKGLPNPKMIERRNRLKKMTMADLRKIGEPLGARDNDKNELIEEILTKEEL